MTPKPEYIFPSLIVAFIIAANIPACNPPTRVPSASQQASQSCEDVYADKDTYSDDEAAFEYRECVERMERLLKRERGIR
jgi:hypothetical protein